MNYGLFILEWLCLISGSYEDWNAVMAGRDEAWIFMIPFVSYDLEAMITIQ